MRPEQVAAVLLAAGNSTRFGEEDKLMADHGGKPLIVHALEAVASLPFKYHIAVVRRRELAPIIHRKLERRGYTLIVNDNPEEGLSGSIVRAAAYVSELRCNGLLMCLADMPNVPQSHYMRLCLAAEDIRSVVGSTDGFTPSPPAFFGRRHFEELQAVKGDQGARALISQSLLLETSSALLHDVDTPDDLRR
ncbi:nucleotidyltransferase family protein [Sphingobium sp. SCG-1]|uniref:nucleotidyltransferase family protein n=1 Tax=Sphingobium sp. SCG-1 TaxID=2072936 RepID=UPI000CD6C144|nr:nucleotidyltransferase family protein [Sphingobium sp. SCG-1]AUW58002.1 nucleotidyltransferase family protein [Sphingobium sp. SCG-1]